MGERSGIRRDETAVKRGLAAWAAHQWPDLRPKLAGLDRPDSGWANETLLVTFAADDHVERAVIRLPQTMPLYPEYRLDAQAAVLDALAGGPVPVPRLIAYETDDQWLGEPFLAMSWEAGRAGPEAPALSRDLLDRPAVEQADLQGHFIDTLATIHAQELDLGAVLRRPDTLTGEVAWWRSYVDWATDGSPPAAMTAAVEWCAAHAPVDAGACGLCWGDVRLGNALFDDSGRVTAVLDWELASLGPPEMDVAWYVVLDDLLERFTGRRVPGFGTTDQVIARYEAAAGRPLRSMGWHQVFALTRSVAISERLARLAARSGLPYPGIAGDDNPVLHELTRRIATYG
ncbi:MAG TPA: phosphotransferase family protein [Acidimicrobiales bacterium]|nr:phosphotransferase family protein [Acidimicrobiales bacterium]